MPPAQGQPQVVNKSVWTGLWLLFFLFWGMPAAYALSPKDLILVYNRNFPGSKAVANYYAARRRVPSANIVAVKVATAENMSRRDFDQNLVPPVKSAAERLKARKRTPAVLLVYGIPLRVKRPQETKADQDFLNLASAKAREYQELVLQMVRELERLLKIPGGGDSSQRRLTIPPAQVGKRAARSLNWALQYLKQKKPREGEKLTRIKVISLLIRLGGTSPEARALAARMSKSKAQERKSLKGQDLLGWNAVIRQGLNEQMFTGILPQTALETATSIRFCEGVLGEWQFWRKAQSLYERPKKLAAVDSELTLALRGAYQVHQWLPNPFNFIYDRVAGIKEVRQKTLMVCRLDGPTPKIAKRLVDDALETEKTGLKGTFYIDARGLQGDDKYGGYAWFDQHLIKLYDLVKNSSQKVVLDRNRALFPPGSCPDAALYVGWYSVGKYVASCKWQKGAVAYHVASAEATTLKKPGSKVWCKRMLEEGVAATLGPVAEPYLLSFPLPDRFFPLLLSGQLPLLEVYFRTLPQVSWMQILIGDPLYTPFKKNPILIMPEVEKK